MWPSPTNAILIAGLPRPWDGRTGSRAPRAPPARRRPAARRPVRCAARSAVASRLFANTACSSPAAGFTQTAAMSASSPTSSAAMSPSATASATPAATPACAAPHVRSAWRPGSIAALLTNSVGGCTASPGRSTATKGTWPARGVASAVAHAVPAGPSRGPSTTLTCAASAPSPTKDSPISSSLIAASALGAGARPGRAPGAASAALSLSLARSTPARNRDNVAAPMRGPYVAGASDGPRWTSARPLEARQGNECVGRDRARLLVGSFQSSLRTRCGSHGALPFASPHDPGDLDLPQQHRRTPSPTR